jgi:formate dehydrogenase subunit gamma
MTPELKRVSGYGRVLHLFTAVSFLCCLISGLGIAFPKLHWMLVLLGGGEFARWLHPWAGVLFSASGALTFLYLSREMLLTKDDRVWLTRIYFYMANRDDLLPETDKYNAGQKLFFWGVLAAGAGVFLISGIPMWFPTCFPVDLVRWGILLHALMFIAAGAGLIVHVYMGTLAMPGTVPALITGKVTASWAKAHHPKWYRKMIERKF